MNKLIVCTCDHCGKVVESWTTFRIELPGISSLSEHREICLDCQKIVKTNQIGKNISGFIM